MAKLKRWNGAAWEDVGGGARSSTSTVAASNSSTAVKASADYVCDGVNDEATINSAINSLGVVGGRVVLLEGTFNIDMDATSFKSIVMPSNITLEGQGNSTILKAPTGGATGNMKFILNSDTTNGNSNIVVRNLMIDGNKGATGRTTTKGIELSKVTNVLIENVFCLNMKAQHGVALLSSTSNAWVINCTFNGGWGIHINGSPCYNIEVRGNTFLNATAVPLIIAGSSSPNENYGIIVADNYFNVGSGAAVSISNTKNITFIGNIVTGFTNEAVGINTNSTNVIVSNNQIYGNQKEGIKLNSLSVGCIVSGNFVGSNSTVTNLGYSNILVAGTNNTVQGNVCRAGTNTNKPKYGIEVISGATGNFVTNNDLTTGGTTGAFLDSGTGTITTAGNKVA